MAIKRNVQFPCVDIIEYLQGALNMTDDAKTRGYIQMAIVRQNKLIGIPEPTSNNS